VVSRDAMSRTSDRIRNVTGSSIIEISPDVDSLLAGTLSSLQVAHRVPKEPAMKLRDADPDIPILKEAKAEYAKLQ
jgi:hypothetical protein